MLTARYVCSSFKPMVRSSDSLAPAHQHVQSIAKKHATSTVDTHIKRTAKTRSAESGAPA
eukprot:3934892-Rhodomonas_salina.2